MNEGYDSRAVANFFVRKYQRDGKEVTIMQILKLVYFAHGWHLAMHDAPLIKHQVQAWKWGPVVPEIYKAFKSQGTHIMRPVPSYNEDFDEKALQIMEDVYKYYGPLSGMVLSAKTHEKGSPWHQMRGYFYAPISDEIIKNYYKNKMGETDG